ncbi:DUF6221 family protein [Streptomyces sp. P17]|uniref:DUF6221 family protein n=1 Tax=Streptomyces sp. P17 TaxID=3074716 RepID=UPI0028F424B7|nr:DUF6221 family protein [Streptomyces sp. P17]MDT9700452.1 DUF6221 family protein [Streptomyces sp. P17]
MSPRRLALVPDPFPGESLLSWGDALARLNQVSRTETLRMAGLISSSTVSAVFGYRVSDAVLRAVSQSTGVTGQRLRSMTLAHYAGSALEPLPPDDAKEYGAWAAWRYRQRTVLPKHSNACPSCLRENGGRWLLKWRLVWSFACVRHQSYLISQCSGCGSALHRVWPGDPQSWICPGASRGLGLRTPAQPCGRDIRRMRGKPVRDPRLLACQRDIDCLLDGPHATTPEEARDVLGALYRSVQDAWSPVRPLRLPATDEAVHRAWDRYLAPGGSGERYRPLLVAAAVKIATEAGPDIADGEKAGSGHARPNWGARQSGQQGEVELAANRFGGRCRHSGCTAWVPAGHGVVLGDTDGWDTYCSRHAQAFTRQARSREHTGQDAFTEPCLRFLDARLRDEEQRLGEEDDDLLRQRIEAQRLILDACAATAARTREGRSLRYAVRCLLLPYAGHPDFRMTWLPRKGENPARPLVESDAGEEGRGGAGRG